MFILLNLQLAEEEEITHQREEMEAVCNPIITKLYQGAPPPPEAGGASAGGAASGPGPKIEVSRGLPPAYGSFLAGACSCLEVLPGRGAAGSALMCPPLLDHMLQEVD